MTSLSKIIFALAALIFAVSQLIHSLQPAHALSSHNISSGTNPIVNINGELVMNSITTTPIWTNNTQDDFIVTTYIQDSTGCYLTVSGQTTGLAKSLLRRAKNKVAKKLRVRFGKDKRGAAPKVNC